MPAMFWLYTSHASYGLAYPMPAMISLLFIPDMPGHASYALAIYITCQLCYALSQASYALAIYITCQLCPGYLHPMPAMLAYPSPLASYDLAILYTWHASYALAIYITCHLCSGLSHASYALAIYIPCLLCSESVSSHSSYALAIIYTWHATCQGMPAKQWLYTLYITCQLCSGISHANYAMAIIYTWHMPAMPYARLYTYITCQLCSGLSHASYALMHWLFFLPDMSGHASYALAKYITCQLCPGSSHASYDLAIIYTWHASYDLAIYITCQLCSGFSHASYALAIYIPCQLCSGLSHASYALAIIHNWLANMPATLWLYTSHASYALAYPMTAMTNIPCQLCSHQTKHQVTTSGKWQHAVHGTWLYGKEMYLDLQCAGGLRCRQKFEAACIAGMEQGKIHSGYHWDGYHSQTTNRATPIRLPYRTCTTMGGGGMGFYGAMGTMWES